MKFMDVFQGYAKMGSEPLQRFFDGHNSRAQRGFLDNPVVDVEDQTKDVFLFGNIVVQVAHGHAGGFGDFAHGGLLVAFFDKQFCGGFRNQEVVSCRPDQNF